MHLVPRRLCRHPALAVFALAGAACARQAEGRPESFTSGHGRLVWTDSTSHELKYPAYHTRCGSVMHVWVQDTFSPHRALGMVVAVLGFEVRAQEVPAYAHHDGRRSGPEAYADLHAADNTSLAVVVGRLRLDRVTDDYVAGQLSGRLVWRTRWDDKPDTSGTALLDFAAPRRRAVEDNICRGPRM